MSEQQISERKITSLEALIGTKEIEQGNLESFTKGLQQVREVLAAASVLLVYYGEPEYRFRSDDETLSLPDLSVVMGKLLADHAGVLALLERKGVKLATPRSIVVPPAKVKFGRARRQKGKGQ